ncbi:fumarate reductase [Frondihabitans sp. PAMC 28766]|uniref:FAD-dependent oxidoreductase n=1 Tax=Frondihabitans sp. PAMC 28766 TaxID=1795630 RepID=UPI00078B17DD|nr:FAD-binding protein [Frondihabitans sp. PAMC 28766]AMM21941.1 fumarate reductase [Frondihabitans sp. PAMC 28766]
MTSSSDDALDLVVAGAGGGLVAALRAAQNGLSVLLVDSNENFSRSNNTSKTTSMIPAAGSRWQSSVGIEDSPTRFVDDVMAKTHGEADRALTEALAEVSAPLVEWMASDLGVPLSLVTDFQYPGHSALRCLTVPGRAGRVLVDSLLTKVRESPLIELLAPARLVDVVTTEGRVRSVVLETARGRREIATKAVLLATNGFGADSGLVHEHLPEIADALYYGSAESTGTALEIGTRLGADTAFLDAYQGHAAVIRSGEALAGWATVMHGGFLVDIDGDRYGNESAGYSEFAAESLERAGGRSWIIIDRTIYEACRDFQSFRDAADSGAVVWGADSDDLAARTGISASGLTTTLSLTRSYAAGDAVDPFGRDFWEAPLRGELAAIAVSPALFHTQGGLRVDKNARVLDSAGVPLQGLYASGGAAMGISGHGAAGYLAGNGLLSAFGLAFLAAQHASAELVTTANGPDPAGSEPLT